MRTRTKLGLLTGLYLSQGLPFGFFHQALPVLLRTQGASLPAIGLTSLLALPWGLKFLWAPFLDALPAGRWGRRRGAILVLQLLAALTLLAVGCVSPHGRTWVVLVAVLFTNLFAATQDIATDALAVDLLGPDERGLGNGVQVGGYRAGMILGGGVILVVMGSLGWGRTFALMAAVLLLATIPITLYREPFSEPPPRATRQAWSGQFQREGLLPWLLVLLLYKSGEALASGMLRTFMVDSGFTLADVGAMVGTVGSAAGLLGAALGGAGVNVFGRKGALVAFGLFQTAAVASYAYAASAPTHGAMIAVVALEHLASGMATAALFTVMMDACRPGFAATDYTMQSCVVVGATGAAATVSGFSAQALGYGSHFLLAAAVSLVGVVYVLFLPRSARRLALPEPQLEVSP